MGRFAKGQSGNPGGRPKSDDDVKALARVHGPAVITELARILAAGKTEAVRVSAGAILLDRAYGKAAPSPEEREDTRALIVQLVKYRS